MYKRQVPFGAALTRISTNVTDTAVGTVRIAGEARVHLGSNATLAAYGDWTNAAVFTSESNGVVTLAGAAPAAVYGASQFGVFAIPEPGKAVVFEAGRTNTVSGSLELSGVALRSSESNAWWYLTLVPGAAQDVKSVRVRDSNAGGGQTIRNAGRPVDEGNNVNWEFSYPRGTCVIIR